MAVTKTSAKAQKVYNPKYLFITPFTDATTKGETIYQVENVVRDSTTITQEDNEENPVQNEFTDDYIVNNVTSGAYTFSTNVGDLQGDLLKDLAGFSIDEVSSKVYAPSGYKEIFAEISLVFEKAGGGYIAATLPKVQLNSTVLLESIKTSVGQITIAGMGYNLEVTDGDNKYVTPFVIDPEFSLPE